LERKILNDKGCVKMINKSQNVSSKIFIAALTVFLFLTCLLTNQPARADTLTRVSGKALHASMGGEIYSLATTTKDKSSSDKYTVTYHPNGGRGQTQEESVDANKDYTIKDQKYTRKYFIFSSWNTRPDGLGIDYSNGQVISLTESITLYAMWCRQI
jgi:hypothetical protein